MGSDPRVFLAHLFHKINLHCGKFKALRYDKTLDNVRLLFGGGGMTS